MRGRLWLIGAGLLTLVGCAEERVVAVPPVPEPVIAPGPAAAAGGACRLLDFALIEEAVGVRFDVSVASKHQKTQTCVVQAESAGRPDLALSVTKTSADAAVFNEEMPSGAKSVKGLGKAAYRLTLASGKGYGAGIEIGWLSGDSRLISLRYTLAEGADKAAAEKLVTDLITLAKKIESVKQKP